MYVCPECREAGVAPEDVDGNVHGSLVACGFCGAVDERATYSRNTIDVSHTFGTLMNEHGTSDIQFREYNEKTHEVSWLWR
jgi:transcription elongation factor Elf1